MEECDRHGRTVACDHVEHVNTQIPYAALVAGISVVAYLIAGACVGLGSVLTGVIMWIAALVLFVGVVFAIKYFSKKNAAKVEENTEEISD